GDPPDRGRERSDTGRERGDHRRQCRADRRQALEQAYQRVLPLGGGEEIVQRGGQRFDGGEDAAVPSRAEHAAEDATNVTDDVAELLERGNRLIDPLGELTGRGNIGGPRGPPRGQPVDRGTQILQVGQ